MKKRPFPSEQSINQALRELTEQTRRLRKELDDMVAAPKPRDLTRSLRPTPNAPTADIPVAADRPRTKKP